MAFDFPSSPTEGQLYTPVGGPTYQYVAPKWVSVGSGGGASITISDTAPSSPGAGALWWESDTGRLMVYYNDGTSSQWVEMLAGGSNATLPVQGWRNRIINGDFAIDQRTNGSGVTVSSGTNAYTLDRWVGTAGQAPGALFVQRIADSTLAGEYYMYVAPNPADATIAAADYYTLAQNIEGNMCRGLNWGTAYAKPITISFNCTAVGGPFTLGISVVNNAGDRSWVGSFTTGTNRISITVPGDITGTWVHDNGIGIRIRIGLAYGTNWQGTAGWQAANVFGLAGMSNFMSVGTNTLAFKDFQVEVGTQATEFERVSYSDQLARCQRYYENMAAPYATGLVGAGFSGRVISGNAHTGWGYFRTTKRAVPTMALTHINASGFPLTAGSGGASIYGWTEGRTANATQDNAFFHSYAAATAEL